jgi:oligoribonuclease
MKYISLDVETTGLNPMTNQVIEIAAILDDSKEPDRAIKTLPTFHCFVIHPLLVWDPETLKMNWNLIQIILFGLEEHVPRYTTLQAGEAFCRWLTHNEMDPDKSSVYAGKNFGSFDSQFIKGGFPGWPRMKHRSFDPMPYYFRPLEDEEPPSLMECCKRMGLGNLASTHRAVDDAEIVIALLRNAWKFGFKGYLT